MGDGRPRPGCEHSPQDLNTLCGTCWIELKAENTSLRETITRLNRRCQEAESAARVKVEEVRKAGPSLGRALAGWAASDYRQKYEAALKEIKDLKNKSKAQEAP